MRVVLIAALAGLAACASVEERTDRRSGPGLSQGTIGSSASHSANGRQTAEVMMTAPDMAPRFAVATRRPTADQSAAAKVAAEFDAEPIGVGVVLGGANYWLRQVQVNGAEFAVAEPDQTPSAAAAADVPLFAASRIGCLPTGQTWTVDGVLVAALDCS